jgi:hypothetical protein
MIHKTDSGTWYVYPNRITPYQRNIADCACASYGFVLTDERTYSWNDFADEICKVYDVVENLQNQAVVEILRQLHKLEDPG